MKIYFRIYYDSGSDASIIAGSSQIASSAIGAMAQSNLNKKTMQFDKDMYTQQRTDALADWNRNNAYNAPSAQMARFAAAGLNPNLIYGNQSTNAAPIRSSTPLSWNPKAPDYSGVAQGIGNALSVKLQQAQLDNLEAQNKVILADASLKDSQKQNLDAQTPGYSITQKSNQFDLDLKNALRDASIAKGNIAVEQARAALMNTLANTNYTLDENDRRAASNTVDLQLGVQKIIQSRLDQANTMADTDQKRATIANLQQGLIKLKDDTDVAGYHAALARMNIDPDSPWYWKTLAALVAKFLGEDPKTPVSRGKADFPLSTNPDNYILPPQAQR